LRCLEAIALPCTKISPARADPWERRARGQAREPPADLVRLGLLRELEGGDRIDVPDLFVSTFGILRGEGAPPVNEASPPGRSGIPA
jgi:hypothetical protein